MKNPFARQNNPEQPAATHPLLPHNQGIPDAPVVQPAQSKLTEEPQYREQGGRREDEEDEPTAIENLGGCLKLGMRLTGCGCMLLLLGAGILGAHLVINRPPEILEPAKQWLNGGLEPIQTSGTTIADVYNRLGTEFAGVQVGENVIEISQTELNVLVKDSLSEVVGTEPNATIEPGAMRIYWNIDETNPENPLWAVLKLGLDEQGKLVLQSVGTESVGTPAFINNIITEGVLSAWNVSEGQSAEELLNIIIPLPENVTITGIELGVERAFVTINVSTGLEDLFEQTAQ